MIIFNIDIGKFLGIFWSFLFVFTKYAVGFCIIACCDTWCCLEVLKNGSVECFFSAFNCKVLFDCRGEGVICGKRVVYACLFS